MERTSPSSAAAAAITPLPALSHTTGVGSVFAGAVIAISVAPLSLGKYYVGPCKKSEMTENG